MWDNLIAHINVQKLRWFNHMSPYHDNIWQINHHAYKLKVQSNVQPLKPLVKALH